MYRLKHISYCIGKLLSTFPFHLYRSIPERAEKTKSLAGLILNFFKVDWLQKKKYLRLCKLESECENSSVVGDFRYCAELKRLFIEFRQNISFILE